jgi:hypothetical protein
VAGTLRRLRPFELCLGHTWGLHRN